MRRNAAREVDMLNGPIVKRLIIFLLPLVATNFLQIFYNAADMAVLGSFVGTVALSSVGSTSSLFALITNVFIGLSAGISVVISQQYGGEKYDDLSDTVHTTGALTIIVGLFVAVPGYIICPFLLEIIKTPSESLEGAILYMRICFLGVPAVIGVNFGASVLRAVGDNSRPFIFLTIAGVLNVVLNLFFVLVCKMSVAGVGAATIISQYVSATLVWLCLMKTKSVYGFNIREIRIVKKSLIGILRIGIPSGLQTSMFAISNVIFQSAVNGFGYVVVAASTACSNIENFIYTSSGAVAQACMVFAGQNVGAGKLSRVKKLVYYGWGVVAVIDLILVPTILIFSPQLISIFDPTPEVIEIGKQKMLILCSFHILAGIYDVSFAVIRGLGYSLVPTLGSVFGACVTRIVWVATVFHFFPTFNVLMSGYPVSWAMCALIEGVLFYVYFEKAKKRVYKERNGDVS